MVWNGNVVAPDVPSMTAFLDAFPLSRHDCQSLDCHPIMRESLRDSSSLVAFADCKASPDSKSLAPELLLTVTGSVLHGPSVMKSGDHAVTVPSEHPRKFREVFVLRPAEAVEGKQPKVSVAQPACPRCLGVDAKLISVRN